MHDCFRAAQLQLQKDKETGRLKTQLALIAIIEDRELQQVSYEAERKE